MKWTAEQEAVFDYMASEKGNLVIEALAGSGKTTTVVEGAHRTPFKGPGLITAFNSRIANELKQKVSSPLMAKTLHAVGYQYARKKFPGIKVDGRRGTVIARKAHELALNQWAEANESGRNPFAYRAWPVIKLEKDLAGIAKGVVPFAKGPEDLVPVAEAYGFVPDALMMDRGFHLPHLCSVAFAAMQLTAEFEEPVVDFNDQIWLPLVKGWTYPAFALVVVDEVQDLSPAQVDLVRRSLRKDGRLIVVGDPNQTLYEFRGARASMLDDLAEEFDCERLQLTTCFRCASSIIETAQIDVPRIQSREGAPVGTVTKLPESELPDVAQPGDFILSRYNFALVPIWQDFLRAGIPAYILGKNSSGPLLALIDKIAKGAGTSRIEPFTVALRSFLAKEKDLATEDSDREPAYYELRDKVETILYLAPYCGTVRDLKDKIAEVFPDSDEIEDDKVVLSTVHKIKGLEADRVFVCRFGMPSGNIRYVAVTRAKTELIWVYGDRFDDLSEDRMRAICAQHGDGVPIQSIAENHGLTIDTIVDVIRRG